MIRVVLVGGGSSSGKSFITTSVIKNIGEDRVTRITLDDYYKDQADMPLEDRYKVNYDHPKAFDWKLMRSHLNALRNGKSIEKPIYDFVNLTRSNKTEVVVPKQLVVVEGIMALVDEDIRNLADLKVFIDASAERRFLRRIIRDSNERGREFENIVSQYFGTVQPMYETIVKPTENFADLILKNDGVENLAIDVLSCIFEEELRIASNDKVGKRKMNEEFTEEKLGKVFKGK